VLVKDDPRKYLKIRIAEWEPRKDDEGGNKKSPTEDDATNPYNKLKSWYGAMRDVCRFFD